MTRVIYTECDGCKLRIPPADRNQDWSAYYRPGPVDHKLLEFCPDCTAKINDLITSLELIGTLKGSE